MTGGGLGKGCTLPRRIHVVHYKRDTYHAGICQNKVVYLISQFAAAALHHMTGASMERCSNAQIVLCRIEFGLEMKETSCTVYVTEIQGTKPTSAAAPR